MRLLVSRPQPDAGETATRLQELGHAVIVQPLLTIVFASVPVNLPRPAAIIFTSRNAVRALARWPMVAAWCDLPVFAVGMETAAAARSAGFAEVRVGLGNARQLGDLIESEMDRSAGAILYPAPREPAGDLVERLSRLGFAIVQIEAYHSEPANALGAELTAALRDGTLDGALFFSRRTAATFGDLVRAADLVGALGDVRLLALSDSVAEPLQALGGGKVAIAAHPTAEALFALISPDL